MRMETRKAIESEKLIAIIRGIYGEDLVELSKALYEGGIRCLEITYDQTDENTLSRIKKEVETLNEIFQGDLILGVGTVLTVEQVVNAKEAGAKFVVSPHMDKELVKEAIKLDLVSIPGAMTPTEIVEADLSGADFVKFFPAGTMGYKYIKDIMAPLNHVKYIATVGITEESCLEYLKMGFAGVGISSRLTDRKLIQEKNFKELTDRARRFVEIADKFK
ncbi:bifunctional 4-hydroxy-2-oxoglutarate aldolase/2-dehydro-3-deoxy-phosphogluconate aldolase [Tepidimicrobium xylanilyticum]|uniref:bifunctional 4-hydroxy-2-oxoglutarate aldolase/2-dehydro-3-deoxy-phosphogluconate aldolase n=1 Tax=Tepidimicrobium xylanilyticum TaxID=1123352 RepID=UPI00265431DA|nr:bifunctional 4-hydroxy-2-oxoglutarate aldolase/2-dehydro-3-deoxy-phosphogluconate aldolase [Tepidimicrobium xylanilyticum]GMG95346.1 ketohydroxyglutarate aldolase [Tepidimicrobium xylanilyticum]